MLQAYACKYVLQHIWRIVGYVFNPLTHEMFTLWQNLIFKSASKLVVMVNWGSVKVIDWDWLNSEEATFKTFAELTIIYLSYQISTHPISPK